VRMERESRNGWMYAPTGVVDDLFDDSANVAVALCKVEVTESGGLLVVVGV
jgi:hypothetical protein